MLYNLKKCKALKVLDVSNCLQLEGEHQITGLVEVCLVLPLLQIFKAEWSCRFAPELVMAILDSSPHISQLAVTPSFWGSQSDLWADIVYGHKNVRFGESIVLQI